MATVTLRYTYIYPYPTKTVQVEPGMKEADTIVAAVQALHGPDAGFERNHGLDRDYTRIHGWITLPDRSKYNRYFGQNFRCIARSGYIEVVIG